MNKYIKDLINQEDWLWKDNLLFHAPIREILSAFFFEKSPSRKNEGFYIWKFNQPLYVLKENFTFTFGQRLPNLSGNEFWTKEEIAQDFSNKFREEFPSLIANEDVNQFIDTHIHRHDIRALETRLYSCLLMQDVKNEKKLYDFLLKTINEQKDNPKWVLRIIEEINNFLSLNIASRKNGFDKYIEISASNLGLDNYLDKK